MSENNDFCEDRCPDGFDNSHDQRENDQDDFDRDRKPNLIHGEYIAKLRGLPWDASRNDILKFFDECEVLNERDGIHIIMDMDNRPSGEAFVEFATADDLEKALKKDRCRMGNRYIEVFRSRQSQFEYALHQFSKREACVKLRGLPFHSTRDDIINFFKDLKIIPNGITMLKDRTGRANGKAYVQFATMEDADEALKKHREKIEHRYIEVFRSCLDDIKNYQELMNYGSGGRQSGSNRPGPYDRNSVGRMNRYQSNSRGISSNSMRYQNNGMGDWSGNSNLRMNNMGSGIGPLMPRLNSGSLGGNMGRINDNSISDRLMSSRINGSNMGSSMGSGNLGMGLRGSQSSRFMGRVNDSWIDRDNRGYSNGSGDFRARENFIHMRGLPYKARTCDIIDFFRPIVPIDVRINFEPNGRATGTADVEFECHDDALDAMTRDRQNMDNRYIELFLGSGPNKNRDY